MSEFTITNIEGYIDSVIKKICIELETNEKDIMSFISRKEVHQVIESEFLGYDNEDQMIIDMGCHIKIVNILLYKIQNLAIAKLASEGYLECAWDENVNNMVFWLSEKDFCSKDT